MTTTATTRNVLISAAALLLVLILGAGTAWAQDEEAPAEEEADDGPTGSMDADLTFASNYVWRGGVLDDGPSLFPSFSAYSGGFSLNAWSYVAFSHPATDDLQMGEVDLTLGYEHGLGPITVGVGGILYYVGVATTELYLSASADFIISPTLSLYYDIGLVDGLYGNLAIDHSFGFMPDALGWDLGVSVGFGDQFQAGPDDKFRLNDLNVYTSLSYNVWGPISLTAGFNMAMLLDSDLSDAADLAGLDNPAMTGSFGFSYAP